MNYILDREGHDDLANAVVITAVHDYRTAWKKYKKGNDRAYCEIKEIESFFLSKWGNLLCGGKAKEILKRLQKEQEEQQKKPKRTVKIK